MICGGKPVENIKKGGVGNDIKKDKNFFLAKWYLYVLRFMFLTHILHMKMGEDWLG